jgi:potassium efflux system protein
MNRPFGSSAARPGSSVARRSSLALRVLGAFVVLLGIPGAGCFAQQSDPQRMVMAENTEISTRIADATLELERARADLAQLRKRKDALDERMRQTDESAQVHTLDGEFARTLIEQLRELPKPRRLESAYGERHRMLEETSDADLRAQRQLRELGDLDAVVARRLAAAQPPVTEGERPQVETTVRELLAEQVTLLTRLGKLRQKLMQTFRETIDADRALEQRSEAARAELNRLLFWIPVPPGTRTVSELVQSIAWTTSPTNWRAAGAILTDEAKRRPFWPAVAVLVAASLLVGRRWLQRGLESLAPTAVTHERYRIGHALAALAITIALALPVPIVMWTAAALLASAPDSQPFAQALSDVLARLASLPLALSTLAWLLDRHGVGVRHFGWDETSLTFAARALRRFAALFVPLVFISAMNLLEHAPFANRESLGRLAMNVAMVTLAVFFVYLFRRKSPLMQRLFARAPRSWPVKLHAVWLAALVAVPLGTAALAVAGYFVAAAYFFARMLYSLFLVIAALALYGLIALWVRLRGSSLALRQGTQAPQPVGVATAGKAGSEIAAVSPPRLDIAAMGEQTRSLLDVLTTLVLLGGMWAVWKDAVPMLSVIGDYALWTSTETVDGKSVTHALTVTGLFLATLVGVVTAVAVRNVGALLDIVLLQRIEMQADATYAIKVVARYALTAAGVMIASNILGIGWNDVQWLVAALGVGLGFGLQEIFANFVSGLIILAERPIRIGDVVTVGDVSGTVSRIRARATMLVDFDNKEVLIPNKSFITDRVINWTLSTGTTRLLIKIAVSSGSDIALVQRLVLGAVQSNPDVLPEPAPSVFFVGFGEDSLDFEIRAFVDSVEKRQRVQHEINLALEEALRKNGVKTA